MSTRTPQLGFPRRVVALYLLISLAVLLLLSGGAAFTVKSYLESLASEDALSRLDRLVAAVEMDQLTHQGERKQALVGGAQQDGGLAYCAVIGAEGAFVAHSTASRIGSDAPLPHGGLTRLGEIDNVRFTDEHGRRLSEYRAPLRVGEEPAGTLVLAVTLPTWSAVVGDLAKHGQLAAVGPLVLIVVGAWLLRNATVHLAGIEERLVAVARLPYGEPICLRATPPACVAAVGWNRVVDRLGELEESGRVEEKFQQLVAAAGGGRTRDALESLSEGIAVTDAEGRIDFANRAVAVLLGQDGALNGSSFDSLVASLCPENVPGHAAGNPNAETISELALATTAGDRTLRLSRAPLAGDAAGGHVWSVRDITQQKLAESSRDQFIDTATHELRTPLANIKAYAETLAMGDLLDVEEQKEFCNTINTEATRLARFVDDLLSISSIEVGSLGVERQNVEVRRLLEEAAEKVRPLMKQRSITFELALGEKLGEARLDKDKVAGLVVNLLGNAAKYTPEGGEVSLTAVRQDDAIKIEVRDTGVGIADEEQEKVFDKFFRSENPDVRDQVGTGLGLSLAREIARLHRGDLTLASKLGEGSTFTALLPTQ